MTRITKNIILNVNDKKFSLDSNLLYLDNEYNDIYSMNYIIPDLLEDDSILLEIKEKFNQFNMAKYFGSNYNLNCNKARLLYNNMVTYFISLFLDKVYRITRININSITNNNDNYICKIAECSSIIRASIKKYIRNRTDKRETQCSKDYLEKRNKTKYKCKYPMPNNEYCPSFSILKNKNGKTCKNILYHTNKTNPLFTIGSKIFRRKYNNNKSRNHIVTPNSYTVLNIKRKRKNKTRKSITYNRHKDNININNYEGLVLYNF